MDWSKIPDILAIVSLACAFTSILRRNPTPGYRLWLVGWVLIALHFVGLMFAPIPGLPGLAALVLGLVSLVSAGIFFMWATVPSETGVSCRKMATVVLLTLNLYTVLACLPNVPAWSLNLAAILIAAGPLTVALFYRQDHRHTLRWLTVGLHLVLGIGLMLVGSFRGADPTAGMNSVLFTVYFGCCLYFWYTHRKATTGSIITVSGFLAWALVFVISPILDSHLPNLHLESEVWNLPKYVVAVGMLLLLLEQQIERSQYLALHDDLTSLANRRLFQDRLTCAMERARRCGTTMALLQIDLDRFKQVNDHYGHHTGDLLLQNISHSLNARVRRSDTLARTGGDEFSLILEEPATRKDAELVADSLSDLLSEPFDVADRKIRIGASIGIAIYPEDAANSDSLSIYADAKMYEIKAYHHRRPALADFDTEKIPQEKARTLA